MRWIYALIPAIALLASGCSSHADSAQLVNNTASLPASFQFEAKGLNKVISSAINRKQATMSTLYANIQAFEHAIANADSSYPDGSVLALVTWKQQEDPHWFGANIPAALQSIELVKINGSTATYERFSGPTLTPASNTDTSLVNRRTRYILEEKPAVIP